MYEYRYMPNNFELSQAKRGVFGKDIHPFESPRDREILRDTALRTEDALERSIIPLPQELPSPIPEPVPDNVNQFLKNLLKSIRDIDWKKFGDEMQGKIGELLISLSAIGEKNIIDIPLPKLEEIQKKLEEMLKRLTPEQRNKIENEMQNSAQEWLRKEREKNQRFEDAIKNPTKGFMTKEERDARDKEDGFGVLDNLERSSEKVQSESIRNLLKDLIKNARELGQDLSSEKNRKLFNKLISSIGLLIAMSGLLGGSSPVKSEGVGDNTIYSDIYGRKPKVTETTTANVTGRVTEQIPDLGITEPTLDIFQNYSLASAEEARNIFGANLGSKFDGSNLFVENKSDSRGSMTVAGTSGTELNFVLVSRGEDGTTSYSKLTPQSNEKGDLSVDLNNLTDQQLKEVASGSHVVWGFNEQGKSFKQAGDSTSPEIRRKAQEILQQRIIAKHREFLQRKNT